ncbi:MAG: hypothetical protein JHD04_15885, partial [Nocardioides sp.]|nr:hypothetical protein [Nocardioides sp.]
MRPTDPRLLRRLAPARRELAAVLAAGAVGGALVLAQAGALAGLLVAVVSGAPVGPWAWALAAALAGRGVASLVGD